MSYFIFNKDFEAITEASKSLLISNGQHANHGLRRIGKLEKG